MLKTHCQNYSRKKRKIFLRQNTHDGSGNCKPRFVWSSYTLQVVCEQSLWVYWLFWEITYVLSFYWSFCKIRKDLVGIIITTKPNGQAIIRWIATPSAVTASYEATLLKYTENIPSIRCSKSLPLLWQCYAFVTYNYIHLNN